MKRKLLMSLTLIVMTVLLSYNNCVYGSVKEGPIRVTYYTDYGVMSSGEITYPKCIAGRKEWQGKAIQLYTIGYKENGDPYPLSYIDTFFVLDTGYGIKDYKGVPGGSIKNGLSVDIWFPSDTEGLDFMDTYGTELYMILYEPVG